MTHLKLLLFGVACSSLSACGTHDDLSERDRFCSQQRIRDADSEVTASIEIGERGEDFRRFVDQETLVVSVSASGWPFLEFNVHATGFLEYGSEDDKQPRDSSDGSSNPLSKVTAFYSSDGAFAFGDFCALGLRYVSIGTAAHSDLREPALGGHIASLPYDNDRVFSEPVILVMEVLDIHGQYGRDEVTVNLQLPVLD